MPDGLIAMKNSNSRTMNWLAALLLLIAAMMPSPPAQLVLYCLSLLLSAIAVISGNGKLRIFAVIILLAASLLAVDSYPSARDEMNHYTQHVRTK